MASSGIEVDQELKDKFHQMKQHKLDTPMQLMVMKLSDDKKRVVMDADHCKETCSHEEFMEFLSEHRKCHCCYFLYDFNNKLFLIKWAPDTAKATEKMIYASTFGALKTAFEGVKCLQASDKDECSVDALEKCIRK